MPYKTHFCFKHCITVDFIRKEEFLIGIYRFFQKYTKNMQFLPIFMKSEWFGPYIEKKQPCTQFEPCYSYKPHFWLIGSYGGFNIVIHDFLIFDRFPPFWPLESQV